MYTLIATPEQVEQLQEGNLLAKYCEAGEASPDIFNKSNSIVYRINKINTANHMIELIAIEDSFIILFSPGHLNRMFIRSGNLLSEGNWWLEQHSLNS